MTDVPSLLAGLPGGRDAYEFAARAYADAQRPEGKGLEHAVEVAGLLARAGGSPTLLIAGLLHDVIEHTPANEAEVRARFGEPVADLVAVLSEDPDDEPYAARKAALRRRLADAGADAAAISLADKLASVRAAERVGRSLCPETLEHYRQTLALLEARHPGLPFRDELRAALAGACRQQ